MNPKIIIGIDPGLKINLISNTKLQNSPIKILSIQIFFHIYNIIFCYIILDRDITRLIK